MQSLPCGTGRHPSPSRTAAPGAASPSAPTSTTDSPQNSETPKNDVPVVQAEPSARKTDSPAQTTTGSSTVPAELHQYDAAIQTASKDSGVPADRISAVIWDESRGQAGAASTNGGNGMTDGGLMQINPETFKQLQSEHPDLQGKSMTDAATNIEAGSDLLADEQKKYGSWDLAERAYNSGEGSVDTSDANITTTGLGDADYIQKINKNLAAIDAGTGLPA